MENMKIKEWYLKTFPNDEMGQDLLPEVTFKDLFEALDAYQDVYVTLFGDEMGGDSVIRERIFQALAEIMEVPYQEIYDQWLMAESNKADKDKETINEGTINFSYSKNDLPTYAFMDNIMEDDMEGQMYLEDTYNMAEDMILDMNSEIADFVARIADDLVDEYQYAYDLEGFVADGPIMIAPGYYDGFTLIIDFDDFNIEGMPEDLQQEKKEMIKDFAIDKMRFVANELGLIRVKSGGWTGPIVVEEAYEPEYQHKDHMHKDEEGGMALVQLQKIVEHAQELMGMLDDHTQLPAWIQGKLTLADHHLQAAADYLLPEEMQDDMQEEMFPENVHYMQAEKSTAPKVRRYLIKASYDQFEDFFGTGHYSYDLSELTEEQILYLKRKAKDAIDNIYEVEPGVEAFYNFLVREGY